MREMRVFLLPFNSLELFSWNRPLLAAHESAHRQPLGLLQFLAVFQWSNLFMKHGSRCRLHVLKYFDACADNSDRRVVVQNIVEDYDY